MHHLHNTEIPFLHFSFLNELKVHGVYYSSLSKYLARYPVIRKEHIHDFYSVVLISKGSNRLKVNNDSYNIEPGSVCLIAPHQIHSYEGLEDMEGSVLLFCQDFYVEEFSYLRLVNTFFCTTQLTGGKSRPCINLGENEFTDINGLLKLIETEHENSASVNDSPVIIRSLLNILLLKLSRVYHSGQEESADFDSIFIHKVSQLVDSNFTTEHNTGFYASAFNISEKRLNDICKKHFNRGLKNILTDRLMHEARKLLITTELSVAEIAYKLNFEDNSYFTKVFKKQTRLAPKRFRDLHRKLVP
jgi:AraC family transcriptional regulator, transcriptional activator of pobA